MGAGCHPDHAVALARALTEAAQSRLTLIAGSRDDCPPAYYFAGSGILERSRRSFAPLDQPGQRLFADVVHVPGESIDEDVAHELDALKAIGAPQVILVDLTRPDIGIPVVRMVVPGLEGWADRGDRIVPGARRRALREHS